MWVSPFRYPRLSGYLLLPAAFRSLSRLSSALSAKASSLRSFLLNLSSHPRIALRACCSFFSFTASASLFTAAVPQKLQLQPAEALLGCLFRHGLRSLLPHSSLPPWLDIFDSQYSVFKVQRPLKALTVLPVMKKQNPLPRRGCFCFLITGKYRPGGISPSFHFSLFFFIYFMALYGLCFLNLAATCSPIPSPV